MKSAGLEWNIFAFLCRGRAQRCGRLGGEALSAYFGRLSGFIFNCLACIVCTYSV